MERQLAIGVKMRWWRHWQREVASTQVAVACVVIAYLASTWQRRCVCGARLPETDTLPALPPLSAKKVKGLEGRSGSH